MLALNRADGKKSHGLQSSFSPVRNRRRPWLGSHTNSRVSCSGSLVNRFTVVPHLLVSAKHLFVGAMMGKTGPGAVQKNAKVPQRRGAPMPNGTSVIFVSRHVQCCHPTPPALAV